MPVGSAESAARQGRGVVAGLAPLGVSIAAATNLQETMPLVWAMTVLSVIGAALTFGILAWALWKFRDPATRGRKYG
ncbi:MAG TPA: hypothetical protein VMH78_04920 [Thermoplasmata archaeon]|nr:hypothetical protein [Thermoplasmata archaeon]